MLNIFGSMIYDGWIKNLSKKIIKNLKINKITKGNAYFVCILK